MPKRESSFKTKVRRWVKAFVMNSDPSDPDEDVKRAFALIDRIGEEHEKEVKEARRRAWDLGQKSVSPNTRPI